MSDAYSVTQVNSYIKNMFARDYVLSRISVQGEVSNCKYHSSGHIYFTLKDSGGTLSAVMFAGRRSGLSFVLEDGMQVEVSGSIEIYERDGKYQMYARKIQKVGLGNLYERFIRLKEQLEEMGMFSDEYKQPVPKHIKTIGIATASTGAAIQDIINVSTRRDPYIQLVFVPTQVQGEGAAESIVRSIKTLDKYGVDVIIVGRGGGSLEDLWAFNEETVARAIFDAHTPIISAVGHETDFTIADYVADLRAPTPSAAAELAAMDYEVFMESVVQRREELVRVMKEKTDDLYDRSEKLALRLSRLSPGMRVREYRTTLELYRERLIRDEKNILNDKRYSLKLKAERLKGLSPLEKIASGYAWVSGENGEHIRSAGELEKNDEITVYFADGRVRASVEEVCNER